MIVGENPLDNFKVLYGTGALRLDADAKLKRVGGVEYTIKDGIVYDAKELLGDIREMVAKARAEEGVAEGAALGRDLAHFDFGYMPHRARMPRV